jgi:pimeloyl-ACP methyl ester carboxylesterase
MPTEKGLKLCDYVGSVIFLIIAYYTVCFILILDTPTKATLPILLIMKPLCYFDLDVWDACPILFPDSNSRPPVFILHGLGERTWTLSLFVWYLKLNNWPRVYTPHWPANTCLLEDCLDALDREMQTYANKSEPIMVIGNSMGGVMAYHLHTRDWNILVSVSVASPIKGSKLYKDLKSNLPSVIFNYFHQPGHLYLERTEQPPAPPHPWFTLGLYFGREFDLHVFLSDMPSVNRTKMWGTHFSLIYDPFVWDYLERGLTQYIPLEQGK